MQSPFQARGGRAARDLAAGVETAPESVNDSDTLPAFSSGASTGPWGRGVVLYYGRFAVGEVAESAEGSRLLSGYRAKSSVQGSNPCLSATRP